MKRFLPIIFFVLAFFLFSQNFNFAFAQTTSPGEGKWVEDQEVTFVGKTATRADDFLNWTLENYDWLCLQKTNNNRCINTNNPLTPFWATIRNIILVLLALFVLAAGFIIVVTRGQNITLMRFVPRFVFVVVLIVLSFALIQGIYTAGDRLQGWFLTVKDQDTNTDRLINSEDLLHIAFGYNDFIGYRKIGTQYEESGFMSLLLVRLTAFTYYAMTGLLLIRKIILWFFIIVSPIFPLLLFFWPLRNTAKIWIGEFFRWLLYGPLFALFLKGLVVLWRSRIPLPFPQLDPTSFQPPVCDQSFKDSCYPLAVNILLGGPGQSIGIANSVNLRDTFALYVVALLMLWAVILVPFLLLNIFLDYLSNISLRDNTYIRQIFNRFRLGPATPPPSPLLPPQPPSTQPAGLARALPFLTRPSGAAKVPVYEKPPLGVAMTLPREVETTRITAETLKLVNLSIPKMRDIARYETSLISREVSRTQEVSRYHSTLEKIAKPEVATSLIERRQFDTIRDRLVEQQKKGEPLAASVLSASTLVAQGVARIPTTVAATTAVATTAPAGVTVAPSRVGVGVPTTVKVPFKAPITTLAAMKLPAVNKVQQVSLEDYEEVRKMWHENYKSLEPPKDLSGQEVDRRQWIKNDIDRINEAITLLTSIDQQKVNLGMEMVANILPFLLIGGFSKTEVITYLKAKLEAAKGVIEDIEKKEEEEETKVAVEAKREEKPKEMAVAEKIEEDKKESPQQTSKDKSNEAEKVFDVGTQGVTKPENKAEQKENPNT